MAVDVASRSRRRSSGAGCGRCRRSPSERLSVPFVRWKSLLASSALTEPPAPDTFWQLRAVAGAQFGDRRADGVADGAAQAAAVEGGGHFAGPRLRLWNNGAMIKKGIKQLIAEAEKKLPRHLGRGGEEAPRRPGHGVRGPARRAGARARRHDPRRLPRAARHAGILGGPRQPLLQAGVRRGQDLHPLLPGRLARRARRRDARRHGPAERAAPAGRLRRVEEGGRSHRPCGRQHGRRRRLEQDPARRALDERRRAFLLRDGDRRAPAAAAPRHLRDPVLPHRRRAADRAGVGAAHRHRDAQDAALRPAPVAQRRAPGRPGLLGLRDRRAAARHGVRDRVHRADLDRGAGGAVPGRAHEPGQGGDAGARPGGRAGDPAPGRWACSSRRRW